jgi:uncharacterized protein (TIGR04255 family)
VTEYSLLGNAPITEALLDIRSQLTEGFEVDRFLTLHDKISNQYPQKKARHKWEGRFEFKKGEAPLSGGREAVDGYIFASGDGKQLFQARLDGFTFNKLKPYDKWESFRDEAFRLWRLYRSVNSSEIVRIALRFINKIDIPLSPQAVIDFDDYLTAGPLVPKELPQGISSFLTRVVVREPDIDASAIITQAFEQIVDPRFVPILLDIDVFTQKEVISEEDVWPAFEKLRHFKNRIFFASITDKTKELFR